MSESALLGVHFSVRQSSEKAHGYVSGHVLRRISLVQRMIVAKKGSPRRLATGLLRGLELIAKLRT